MALDIVIMAAGKGTRMKSRRPKVLHRLAGRSLLAHVLQTADALASADGPRRCWVITGHGADEVESAIAGSGATPVRQQPQLGTGHAVQQVAPHLAAEGTTLILNGDVPLIAPATAACCCHTAHCWHTWAGVRSCAVSCCRRARSSA